MKFIVLYLVGLAFSTASFAHDFDTSRGSPPPPPRLGHRVLAALEHPDPFGDELPAANPVLIGGAGLRVIVPVQTALTRLMARAESDQMLSQTRFDLSLLEYQLDARRSVSDRLTVETLSSLSLGGLDSASFSPVSPARSSSSSALSDDAEVKHSRE